LAWRASRSTKVAPQVKEAEFPLGILVYSVAELRGIRLAVDTNWGWCAKGVERYGGVMTNKPINPTLTSLRFVRAAFGRRYASRSLQLCSRASL